MRAPCHFCGGEVEPDLAAAICLRCRLARRLFDSAGATTDDSDLRRAIADVLDGMQNWHTAVRVLRTMGRLARLALDDQHLAARIRNGTDAEAVELLRTLLPTPDERRLERLEAELERNLAPPE